VHAHVDAAAADDDDVIVEFMANWWC